MSKVHEHLSDLAVRLGGRDAPPELMNALWEVTVENTVHLPDVATLVVHDPALRWTDSELFEPGTEVVLTSQTGNVKATIFEGEVVEVEPEYAGASPRLVVRAFDRLHRLTRGRHVRRFANVTDGDLVRQVGQQAGLSQVEVGPQADAQVYEWVFQDNETNLAFLQRRAAALGYVVYVRGKTLHFGPPQGEQATLELKWGESLAEFRPRLTTLEQPSEVVVRGWDFEKKEAVIGKAKAGQFKPKVGESGEGGEKASKAFGEAPQLVECRPVRTQKEAQLLAEAAANKQSGRFIQAEGSCGGNPALVAGARIRVSNVGRRFSGEYVVTTAQHVYAQHGGKSRYTTHFTVSANYPLTLLSLLRGAEEPPSRVGLAVGVVTNNDDPKGLGRVKVKYPALSDEAESDWARVVSVGGGKERGVEFLPEVNDEVLVAFELGDVNHPYVLGGLWNGVDLPPRKSSALVASGKVKQRLIRSRTGHLVILDDSDDAPGVTIKDRNGNVIHLDTKKDTLTVEVKGDVNVVAKGNARVQAQQNLDMEGTNVKVTAKANLRLEGSAMVEVKGGVIKLN
ncbi:Rhs element Vgr protein [Calidithermus terrae]|uniref:Rhs element Vgr protein n=1 Tax=Calidithermus terrae TaxID=1408545 RepID=A0A399DX77_9DEIN|nr:VgrG-related protein [Calidithermus terrae]RIH76159.1 Rhs element Vgr protein [Calidithermus terrae]